MKRSRTLTYTKVRRSALQAIASTGSLLRVTVVVLAALLVGSGCSTDASTGNSLKLAHGMSTDHPVHLGMVYMADYVDSISAGQLQLEIYPSQQLGGERQLLELLQIGSLAMTKVSASVMENFAPKMKVMSLPYLFRGREHVYAFQDSPLGRQMLEDGSDFWLRGLTYFDAGQRSFYTKDRPVKTPADLKGLKIRVMESQTAMQMVKSLGGAPTPISYGELYTALQQGIVDGAENNPPSFYTSRHYEVCKHYTLNEHTSVPDLLIISTVIWDRLTEQERKWLQHAADAAKQEQRRLWIAAENEALEAVQKAGVQIYRPDKATFYTKTAGLLTAYKDQPAIYNLIQQIQNIED